MKDRRNKGKKQRGSQQIIIITIIIIYIISNNFKTAPISCYYPYFTENIKA